MGVDKPNHIWNLCELKEPMKFSASLYGGDERTAVFPAGSFVVVQAEVSDYWASQGKVNVIPLSDQEFLEIKKQRERASDLNLFPGPLMPKENVVGSDRSRSIKQNLNLSE